MQCAQVYRDRYRAQDAIRVIVAKTGRTEDEARAELASANPQKRLIQPQEVSADRGVVVPAK